MPAEDIQFHTHSPEPVHSCNQTSSLSCYPATALLWLLFPSALIHVHIAYRIQGSGY